MGNQTSRQTDNTNDKSELKPKSMSEASSNKAISKRDSEKKKTSSSIESISDEPAVAFRHSPEKNSSKNKIALRSCVPNRVAKKWEFLYFSNY